MFKLVEFIVELAIKNAVIVMLAQHWQTDEWCLVHILDDIIDKRKDLIFNESEHNLLRLIYGVYLIYLQFICT